MDAPAWVLGEAPGEQRYKYTIYPIKPNGSFKNVH